MGKNTKKHNMVKKISRPVANMIKKDFDDIPEIIATAKKAKHRNKTAKSSLVGTLKSAFLAISLSCVAFIYSYINNNEIPTFFFCLLFIFSFAFTVVLYINSYTSGKLTMDELKLGLWSKKIKETCEKSEENLTEDINESDENKNENS